MHITTSDDIPLGLVLTAAEEESDEDLDMNADPFEILCLVEEQQGYPLNPPK